MESMERLKGVRILVTGGTGFAGSHVVESLLEKHARIVISYRSIDPHCYFFQKNLSSSVILAMCDLKDEKRVRDIIAKYEIEYILHLGAQPIVETAYYNPSETIESNIMGTLHILEGARSYPKIKGIIIASSDKAYGKHDKPYKETDTLRGDHPYEVSKSAADLIAFSYVKTYGMPIAVTRFGNIYGPGDLNFNRIIPGIMQTLITGKELEIRSNGKFVREYLYVKDVASAYLFLLTHFSKASGEAFNIASGERYSVLELIKKCKEVFHEHIPYKILNSAINEIPEQRLYCKKIRNIGWKPKYSITKGLKETYEWNREYFEKFR